MICVQCVQLTRCNAYLRGMAVLGRRRCMTALSGSPPLAAADMHVTQQFACHQEAQTGLHGGSC